jgi:hypothetical protein
MEIRVFLASYFLSLVIAPGVNSPTASLNNPNGAIHASLIEPVTGPDTLSVLAEPLTATAGVPKSRVCIEW